MNGPLSYIGGKRPIAKQLIALFPEHTTYVEAFAGRAQVFFHKPPSRVEALNDLDGEVVNFYRVCQNHYEELIR
jgi:DNA adenine methylase